MSYKNLLKIWYFKHLFIDKYLFRLSGIKMENQQNKGGFTKLHKLEIIYQFQGAFNIQLFLEIIEENYIWSIFQICISMYSTTNLF